MINPVLEVGQVTEQVEVQANAALVETRNTSVGAVIENQRILELPLKDAELPTSSPFRAPRHKALRVQSRAVLFAVRVEPPISSP